MEPLSIFFLYAMEELPLLSSDGHSHHTSSAPARSQALQQVSIIVYSPLIFHLPLESTHLCLGISVPLKPAAWSGRGERQTVVFKMGLTQLPASCLLAFTSADHISS